MPDTHVDNLKVGVSGTPGTGTATVGSAASGCRGFVAGDNGKTFSGRWTDGTAWETATGCLYTHSGTTLTRGTLKESSTGSAISLTSAAVFECSPVADLGNKLEAALQACVPGGRLTLESGVPISTSDQTAKTTIYYTPFVHNTINLWDGSNWKPTTFAETSLALGTLTSGKPYDVFGYISGGALALELLAWTNDTTRATAVTLQDGRYCKSGDKTRLLLGSFYTTSTTTTEDSEANRYLANLYNQFARTLINTTGDAGHTYQSTTVRPYNNNTAHRVNFMSCVAAELVAFGAAYVNASLAGSAGDIFIGYDSTTASSAAWTAFSNSNLSSVRGAASGGLLALAGAHYVQLLERGHGTNAVTYSYGLLRGTVKC